MSILLETKATAFFLHHILKWFPHFKELTAGQPFTIQSGWVTLASGLSHFAVILWRPWLREVSRHATRKVIWSKVITHVLNVFVHNVIYMWNAGLKMSCQWFSCVRLSCLSATEYSCTVYLFVRRFVKFLFIFCCCCLLQTPCTPFYLQALGSMYFIHNTLKNIYQYDFQGKEYVLSGIARAWIFTIFLFFS